MIRRIRGEIKVTIETTPLGFEYSVADYYGFGKKKRDFAADFFVVGFTGTNAAAKIHNSL